MDLISSMAMYRRVVEAGSFSAVARETDISQPTISKHVQALENHLGVKLLNRTTRSLALTEPGKDYYQRCIRILDELAEAEASVGKQSSSPTGILRINVPVSFGRTNVLPVVWSFLEKFPDIDMDVIFDDHYSDLVKEGIDLAIRIGPLFDSSLVANKLGSYKRLTVASHSYLEQFGEPKNPEELKQHNCIVFSLLTTGNEWHYYDEAGELRKVRVKGRIRTTSPDAMREATVNGFGISVAPTWLVQDAVDDGSLKQILTGYTPTSMELNVLYPERHFVPLKVRAFIKHMRENLD
ncbi:MAG: LysR family transcriptional regulator [Gammaproteobacteria bacterium]|nr:LysR family transcriptional regulator [Gammaproteobacteria bacterium]